MRTALLNILLGGVLAVPAMAQNPVEVITITTTDENNKTTTITRTTTGVPMQSSSPDEWAFQIYSSVAYLPIKVRETMTTYNDNASNYFGSGVVDKMRLVDTTGSMVSVTVGVGVSVPFYKTDNWSVGANLGAGIGLQRSIKATEGLEGFIYEFPEYVYYRNYKTSIDFAVMLGYKYTKAPLKYQAPMAAVEVRLDDFWNLRLFGSLLPQKYYLLYSDGREEESLRIHQIGLATNMYF